MEHEGVTEGHRHAKGAARRGKLSSSAAPRGGASGVGEEASTKKLRRRPSRSIKTTHTRQRKRTAGRRAGSRGRKLSRRAAKTRPMGLYSKRAAVAAREKARSGGGKSGEEAERTATWLCWVGSKNARSKSAQSELQLGSGEALKGHKTWDARPGRGPRRRPGRRPAPRGAGRGGAAPAAAWAAPA